MTDEVTRGEVPPRVKAIEELGAKVTHQDEWVGKVGPERHPEILLDTARGVYVPLTAQEWCDLCMREGDHYMGGCCGNMSQLQDIINRVFRDSGHIDGHVLLKIGRICQDHEGFDAFAPMDDEAFDLAVKQWERADEMLAKYGSSFEAAEEHLLEWPKMILGQRYTMHPDPWHKLGVIYNALEPMLKPLGYETPKGPGRNGEEVDLIHVLSDQLARMSWGDLFTPREDEKPQHEADRQLLRAQLYPMITRLAVHLAARLKEPYEGYAIVRSETQKPLTTSRGICIYPTLADAEREMELWGRYAREEAENEAKMAKHRQEKGEEPKPEDDFWRARIDEAEIVPIVITRDDGLTLLEEKPVA